MFSKLISCLFSILLFSLLGAQNADCDKMIILKDSVYQTKEISGFGMKKEFFGNALENPKTFENEENSIWYFITAEKDAIFTFDILSKNEKDDWDFLLFPYSKDFCSDFRKKEALVLRSNLSRGPNTGLSINGKEKYIGAGVNENYSSSILVKERERFVLVVNNSKRKGGKHSLKLHYKSKKSKDLKSDLELHNALKITTETVNLNTKFIVEVKEEVTKKPLIASMTIEGIRDGFIKVIGKPVAELELEKQNQDITINVFAKGYMLKSQKIKIGKNKSTYLVSILLSKIEKGQKVNLKNIQFYGNQDLFLPKANSSLKALFLFMKENKNVSIQIEGHVNGPGQKNSKAYKGLSLNRAFAVKRYLMENGVSEKRIDCSGYGNSKMVYPKPKSKLQESENRRVEIKIVSNAFNPRN